MPRHARAPRLPAALLLATTLLLPTHDARAVTWRLFTSPVVNVPIASAGAGDYLTPVSCSDGRGGTWVAYVDDPGSSDSEIAVRRLGSDGSVDVNRTLTSDAFDQDQPQVVASDSGGVYVVWRDARNTATTGVDLYVQYVGPEGLARWAANGVQVTNAAGTQQTPCIGLGFFGLVVAWLDDRNGAANSDVYFTRIDRAGVVASLAGSVVTTDPTDQSELSGGRSADGLLLVWRDPRNGNADIYGESISSLGSTSWGVYGDNSVCTAAGTQSQPRVVSDGGNGAWVVWQDLRGADLDVYAQHVSNAGVLHYGSGGAPVCNAALQQFDPRVVSDGSGGAILGWLDDRAAPRALYAQRLAPNGVGLWAANGINVASGASGTPYDHQVAADGLGGAYFAWSETRVFGVDLYGQRVSGSGSVQWTTAGALISGAGGTQDGVTIMEGGENSLLAVWEDQRTTVSNFDLYAQRVDRYGFLGDAAPNLVDVSDVLGDQGGQVRVDWTPGYVEFDPFLQVSTYFVLRQVPAALAVRLQQAGARLVREPAEPRDGERVLLAQGTGATATYWEYVGQSPAFQSETYSYVAPTTSDSVAGVPASTSFMLQARNSSGSRYWFSNVRVGGSVDNLAPLTPAPFAGTYAAGTARLTWNPNREPDLAGYRLYRGTTPAFVPGPGNLASAQPDTGYVDPAGAPFVYKLAAVDVHGNESPVATLLPSGVLAADGAPAARAYFAVGSANPVRAGAHVALRLGLATAGEVRVALYDTGGRRVRALAHGARESGEHVFDWDGRDDSGRAVAPGLYFARVEAPGLAAARKLVVRD